MGSRMMHLLIADRVATEIGVTDRARFLLGGVAPDAHQLMGVPKDASHFLAWVPERKRKVVEYERFAAQYAEYAEDAFIERSDLLSTLQAGEIGVRVCEVDDKAVHGLKRELEADFAEAREDELEEFSWSEILEYIDDSVRVAKGFLTRIPNKK